MPRLFLVSGLVALFIAACAPTTVSPTAAAPTDQANLKVVAVETFLADIAQNVAGDRIKIDSLMPIGADPHSFEPTPQDIRKVSDSDVLIVNGMGFEEFLNKLLTNAGGKYQIIEATKGLKSRAIKPNDPHDEDNPNDPHMWFDPNNVITYVTNIRDGLTQADPAGAATYKTNADAYISKLRALDAKIQLEVETIPVAKRKLVTDHDTFGYYADRYGFEIVGMLVPSFTTADSSTAQQLAHLVDQIKATGAKAIFIEQSTNPAIADQIARDTGAKVVTGLYTHSLSEPSGPAATYIQMLEYDTQKIVDALE
ncbi:MAG TPA: zinc ABC transporter substrate-binding protein [Anaerolineae bacterium]|nr:zinc ABC transporter substrate-binding protein [Anaerolineae bacterium]